MNRVLLAQLGVMVTVLASALVAASRPAAQPAGAQGSQLRVVLPLVSRDVLPDVVIEAITVTRSDVDEAAFRYRIRNAGDAPADLSRFTMQAWFSVNETLEKQADIESGLTGFTVVLQPGALLEAEATASAPDAPITAFPFLILELDSAGSVVESNTLNNVRAARRPPLDLVTGVQLAWDEAASRATVTWTFRGASYGIADEGFRIEAPGFGVQEVPAGTRAVTIPFNPLSGARPCVARVAALRAGAEPWPAVESNRLCQ